MLRPPLLFLLALPVGIALGACGSLHATTSVSGQVNRQLLLARCMRTHGVPDWADPTFPPGGGIEGGGLPSGSSRSAPSVQSAARTCNRLNGL